MPIYKITKYILQNSELMDSIYKSPELDYFYSDDFSPAFYVELAKAGFITVGAIIQGQEFLLPEIQKSYALLDFNNLHTSKKVKKLITKNRFYLKKSDDISRLISHIKSYHIECWIGGRYTKLLLELELGEFRGFELCGFELVDREDGRVVAGEIGYFTHNIYTSLTGFFMRKKEYNNCGNLQLVLLAKELEYLGLKFWNLGHPYMNYKLALGAHIVEREEFLAQILQ
ncbi:MAG: hypothetical protein ACOCP1_02860 [Campylobacterales bacterium]